MGALANAQGTMNNLTFGNATYQYYETICSGSPAGRMNDGRGFAGTSGVHTHMTNSRLTDPEVLELRFPVLLEDFHIREGSGGNGKWSAGDGTRRTHPLPRKDGMRDPVLASLAPAARPGRRRRRRRPARPRSAGSTARIETLNACDQTVLEAGEAVIVTTPTGGGYGKPGAR